MNFLRKFIKVEKLEKLILIIRQNGGIAESFKTLYRTDELKWGNLVGHDKYGNKYYENKEYFIGRSRWIMFKTKSGMNYDATEIPPDWHRWMHYMTDDPPSLKPLDSKPWMINHQENMSGTAKEYVPYSTTRPKIEAWDPTAQKSQ